MNCETALATELPATAVAHRPPHVTNQVKKWARKSERKIPVQISGTAVPDCFGQLTDIDAGIVDVRTERQIPESSPVTVSFNHTQLSGIVADCRPAGPEWVVSIALSACKRRLGERIPDADESVIGIVEGAGTSLHKCTVLDTSAFGLGLRLSFPIQTGARICVEMESTMVFGEVRHCHPKLDGEFIAGVLIVDVVPDARTQTKFSLMLNNLRWKLASSIRGRDVPVSRNLHQ